LNATTNKRIVPFLMPPYKARSLCSRVCCLALALVLVALPSAGFKAERAPILVPFGPEPLPMDTSLQSAPGGSFQIASFLVPGRLILGPSPSPGSETALPNNARIHITSLGLTGRAATSGPNGRAPPSA
jgi:hypothetical protein